MYASQYSTLFSEFIKHHLNLSYISFSHNSTAEIKSYLVEYCAQKNKLGYIALQDPLSTYYEALCTGLETVGVFIDEDENTIPRWSLSLLVVTFSLQPVMSFHKC